MPTCCIKDLASLKCSIALLIKNVAICCALFAQENAYENMPVTAQPMRFNSVVGRINAILLDFS